MPASEPIAGIPWLLWRPSRAVRAPNTRAPVWLRSRRRALVRIGGLWLRISPGRGVPLLAPVDHPVDVLAVSTAGLARAKLRIDSNLPMDEPAVPSLDLDPDRLAVERRRPVGRSRDWRGRIVRRSRRRPRRPAPPPDFARPSVPGPSFGGPAPRRAAPLPLADTEMPGPLEVPEPIRVPRWYDMKWRRPSEGRAGRRTS
jgi:hypothetical protein